MKQAQTTQTPLAPGEVLGGVYRIEQLIDENESGRVYRATQIRLNRPVAVKTLATESTPSSAAQSRLNREAHLLSKLQHPHIVDVLDFDRSELGVPFLVMELLVGGTLAAELRQRGPEVSERMQVADIVRLGAQLASGLAVAHAGNVVHGALSPASVFLVDAGDEPFAKLTHFKLRGSSSSSSQSGARRLSFGKRHESPDAPYQAPVSGQTRTLDELKSDDQYALAVIMYEMLTGKIPESRRSLSTLFRGDAQTLLPPSKSRAGVPAAIDRVLLRALSSERMERYPSMKHFSSALLEAGRTLLNSQRPSMHRVSTIPKAQARASSIPAASAVTPPGLSRPGSGPSSTGAPKAERHSLRDTERPVGGSAPSDVPRQLESLLREVRSTDHSSRQRVDSALVLVRLLRDSRSVQVERRIADYETMIQDVFIDYLGGEDAKGQLVRYPESGESLSPQHVFLLSRLEGGATVGDVVQVSPLGRLQSWALLADLKRRGLAKTEG